MVVTYSFVIFYWQVEEIEGKPLVIPTVEQELNRFVEDSPLKHLTRTSILSRKPTYRSQLTFDDTSGAPLPSMAILEDMAATLQTLINASCEKSAHKKVKCKTVTLTVCFTVNRNVKCVMSDGY